jgi:hypothetical protein
MLWCTSAGRVRLTRAKLSSHTHPLGLQLSAPTYILEERLLENCLPVNLIPSKRPAGNSWLQESLSILCPCAAQSYPMCYYSVAYCRAFLWILDDSLLCTILAPVVRDSQDRQGTVCINTWRAPSVRSASVQSYIHLSAGGSHHYCIRFVAIRLLHL